MAGGQRMMVPALAAGVGAAVALLMGGHGGGRPAPAQAAQVAPATAPLAKYLRFTGTGTVQVNPDTASISFTTNGSSGSKASAVSDAGSAMRRVIAAMERNGVGRGDLQTSSNVYEDTSRGVWEASEYQQVTVHSVHGAGGLVSKGLAAGADSSSGPDFSLSSQSAGYDAALRAAVADARAHADAAAALIGDQVTGVISVDDTPTGYPTPTYGMALDNAQAMPVMPVRQGKQQVTVSVEVTFSYGSG